MLTAMYHWLYRCVGGLLMQVAKVFRNGGSQAIRLPKDFRVLGEEVYLKKTPEDQFP
jgi:hypothetical protein